MNKNVLIAWALFLAGVALVVGYALKSTFTPTPVVTEVPGTTSGQPQLEITISGQANGVVVINLMPELAPKHVEQVTALARQGAYDGVVFHRVIDGFIAQTGDVQFGRAGGDLGRAGMGASDLPDIPAEFSDYSYVAGTVGMARSNDPNSANSQFFIMFAPGEFLDGKYTVIGQVASGFDVVQSIKLGEGSNGAIIGTPDVMSQVRVLEAQ